MSDQNLPTSGKDVRVELMLDGIPQKVVDQIVRFTERPRFQTIETRPLGTDTVDIDKVPDGWEGELEISQKSGQLEDLIDAWTAARRARIPVLINIVRTKYFRDGTSRTHVYPDAKIEFSSEMQRGQATTVRIPWTCGRDRF